MTEACTWVAAPHAAVTSFEEASVRIPDDDGVVFLFDDGWNQPSRSIRLALLSSITRPRPGRMLLIEPMSSRWQSMRDDAHAAVIIEASCCRFRVSRVVVVEAVTG